MNKTATVVLNALDAAIAPRPYHIGEQNNRIAELERQLGLPRSGRFMRARDASARIKELEALAASHNSSGAAPRNALPSSPVATTPAASVPLPKTQTSPPLPRACYVQIATRCFSFDTCASVDKSDAQLRTEVEAAARKHGVKLPGMEPQARTGGTQAKAHNAIRQDMADAILKSFVKSNR